ncbi:MAG TPA: ATP-binding cassette domain-containing protein, partial [Micromonosporaceae bacterium]
TALLILILAPEAYLPLRQLGLHYHASTEGLAAASRVFEILDQSPPRRSEPDEDGGPPLPPANSLPVVVDRLRIDYPRRPAPAVDGFCLRAEPGEMVVLTGPSGAGKSTVLSAILGFVEPTAGRVCLGEGANAVDLGAADPDAWLAQLAYLPQRPYLFAGTVADNIRLGCPSADHAAILRAAGQACLDDLPDGLSTLVDEGGAGLSTGQRQRVGLARVFLRDAGLVLLDEPTANLDRTTEQEISQVIRSLAGTRTVIAVSHRPALVRLADRVVRLPAAPGRAGRTDSAAAQPAVAA